MSNQQNNPDATQTNKEAAILLQMLTGGWVSQMIIGATKLGIADLLMNSSQSISELAQATNTHPESLYRLLRALSSLNIFAEKENRYFENTSMSMYLASNNPSSLQGMALMIGQDWQQEIWKNLDYSLKTGLPTFHNLYGCSIYEYLSHHPDIGNNFDSSMNSFATITVDAIAEAYDFSSFSKIVDVAGGRGMLLNTILKDNPSLKGILFDLPEVIERVKTLLSLQQECIELKSGNYFENLPTGADAYILKMIIHNWDDESAIKILQNCHKVMSSGQGKLLIIEHVIPDNDEPDFSKILDLQMLLIMSGGRERTASQFNNLLNSAGFKLTKIIPTRSTLSIIEAQVN